MATKSSLSKFVSGSLLASDAIVEVEGEKLVCLLPPNLATHLAVEEECVLLPPYSKEEGQILNYAHPILDNLIELIQGEGRVSHIEFNEMSTQTGGLRGLVEQRVKLRQALGDIESTVATSADYFILHLQLQARCNDREYNTFTSVACNEETLASTPWLLPAIGNHTYREINSTVWRTPFPQLYEHLQGQLQKELEPLLESFLINIRREISREKRRLERIHRRERKNLLQPLQEDPTLDQEKILQDIQELEEEYKQAVAAIPDQHPVDIQWRPFAALRLTMPVTRVKYNIRHRKNSRTISWIWNPIIEDFEPLLCEKCGNEGFDIVPVEDLVLACPLCTS